MFNNFILSLWGKTNKLTILDDSEIPLQVVNNLPLFLSYALLSVVVSYASQLFFSLSQQQRELVGESDNFADKIVTKLLLNPNKLYINLFIIRLFSVISLIIEGYGLLMPLFSVSHTINFAKLLFVATLLLFLFILVELIPRILLKYSSLKQIRLFSIPLKCFDIFLTPITFIPYFCGEKFPHIFKHKNTPVTIGDLSIAINESGSGEENENKKIFSGILRFVATEVSEIMTPRVDVVAIEFGENFERVKEIVVKSGFSRLPVYEDEIDNIKGVVYTKDLIAHIDDKDFKWQSTIRKPYYIPENKMINDLLHEFQARRVHLAIVVDEYGSLEGVISLEDILEEIVGEISDESDKIDLPFVKISENEYIFDGKTHISDFQKIFELTDEYFDTERGDAESLAGLMLEVRSDFLAVGDTLKVKEFEFIVLTLSQRRIEKIKVLKNH